MCGIVAYYGNAENRLTRILSGMWAIIYRAPDSTGLGLIGSELEPLKIRKELGSFDPFIDRLLDSPVFDEDEMRRVWLLTDDLHGFFDTPAANQQKLLAFEGFDQGETAIKKMSPPRWSELTTPLSGVKIAPGTPGTPDIRQRFPIDSPKNLKKTIERLGNDCDLPLGLVEKLISRAFAHAMEQQQTAPPPSLNRNDLAAELQRIFYHCAHGEPFQKHRDDPAAPRHHPHLRKQVWHFLKNVEVVLPCDYTTDGIANLFRNIDSNVLTRTMTNPAVQDKIQDIFVNFWAMYKSTPPVHWRSLYKREKLHNVYGLAAAAALTYFQTEIYMKHMGDALGPLSSPPGHVPGSTHPLLLKFMVQPVIAQGRWAIQSSISVRNAHPFVDEHRRRSVVLNGMFSSALESKVRDYITTVAGIPLRSENSTEMFAMLWGHYFDTISDARKRYRIIERQHHMGLEEFSISSTSVDYGIFTKLQGKSEQDLDELAFIKACETMCADGGQFAVSGISLISPSKLFIGAHKRPVYIVKRRDTSDFMVVSDVNAAIGLFPQNLILSVGHKLRRLMAEYSKKSLIVEPDYFDDSADNSEAWFKREKMALLAPFRVDIHALSEESTFARVETKAEQGNVLRELEILDFSGREKNTIQAEQTYLTPITFKKEFGKTFYEEHLLEIPPLFHEILNRHSCPKTDTLFFDIKTRLLQRRFGKKLSTLNRIILVGTGTSFLLTEIVEKNMEQFFTGVNLIEATPHEFNNIDKEIDPDRDLVVLVSWSGTTSDMVDFASRLEQKRILMIGITEKPFSDLALIVRGSGGIIPVLSGEEVTLVATKSAVSTLLTLYLLCLYLAGLQSGSTAKSAQSLQTLRQLPPKLTHLLQSDEIVDFCKEISVECQKSTIHYLVDSLYDIGTSRLSAMNLEINAWNSMGITIDYSTLDDFLARQPQHEDMIVVSATSTARLDQAVSFMSSLGKRKIPFYAVSYKNREIDTIQALAARAIIVPKTADYLQPFIDLVFMFLMGFYYGLARGRLSGQLPRNITKSITAGRARTPQSTQIADTLAKLNRQNSAAVSLYKGTKAEKTLFQVADSLEDDEKNYYREMRQLCTLFQDEQAFSTFFTKVDDNTIDETARLIFSNLAEDGIIIFVPTDRAAEGGCRNFVHSWSQFFQTPMQVEFPEKLRGVSTQDSLLVIVASKPPEPATLDPISTFFPKNILWVGPDYDTQTNKVFSQSHGNFVFRHPLEFCHHIQIYFGLSLLFLRIIRHHVPKVRQQLTQHFKLLLPSLEAILFNENLRHTIDQAVEDNRFYKKRLFITGLRGNCTFFKQLFHRRKNINLESEIFGVSAHTHLVLIDPACRAKYVRLTSRQQLLQISSEERIRQWEKRYLAGSDIDAFLKDPGSIAQHSPTGPLWYEDAWYLPVIQNDYDMDEDCLVIIDATSESSFDAALDELATFGSRYARLLVITQQAFGADSRLADLKKHPLSEIILVPGIPDDTTHGSTLSDYILPMALNVIGTAMYYAHERLEQTPVAPGGDRE
ncbi:MAG: SIS domain-containing protein [Desulfopila sp.]